MNLERVIAVSNTKTVYKDSGLCYKVFDDSYTKSSILSEAVNLTRIGEIGIKVPEFVSVNRIEGQWALVTQYIQGKTLSQLIDETPKRKSEYLARLVDIQLDIQEHTCDALPNLKQTLRRQIILSEADEKVCKELLYRLDEMPDQTNVCHGELELSNVIITPDDQAFILDWGYVTQGDALADAAGTYLSLRMYGDLSGANIYLNHFCSKNGTDIEDINKWLPFVAAARSVSKNKRERELLLRWANLFDWKKDKERT